MANFPELIEPGTPVPPGGPGTPDPAKEAADEKAATRKKAQTFGMPKPGYAAGTSNVQPPGWRATLDALFERGNQVEGRSVVPTTKGAQGPMLQTSGGPAGPGQAQQLMDDALLRGSPMSTRVAATGEVGARMAMSPQTPPVDPMAKAMSRGTMNAANFGAAPAPAVEAPSLLGRIARAAAPVARVAGPVLGGVAMADQVLDPNSRANQDAAATAARSKEMVAQGHVAQAIGNNLRGAGNQFLDLTVMPMFDAAASVGRTAVPALRDFTAGLVGADPYGAPKAVAAAAPTASPAPAPAQAPKPDAFMQPAPQQPAQVPALAPKDPLAGLTNRQAIQLLHMAPQPHDPSWAAKNLMMNLIDQHARGRMAAAKTDQERAAVNKEIMGWLMPLIVPHSYATSPEMIAATQASQKISDQE